MNRHPAHWIRAGILAASLTIPAIGLTQTILEEVVVTAQKREQSLQDVPISVASVNGDDVLVQGLTRMEDIAAIQPSLRIVETYTGQSLQIRGVGTGVSNISFEQSVAQFVDGVYSGRGRNSLVQFLDIESVETLRGPQPTYFGQNAIAGALNTRTRGPGNELEGYINAFWDVEFGTKSLDVAYGGPLSDSFGVRMAARLNDDDGFGWDTHKGEKVAQREGEAVRLSFNWLASEDLTVSGKWEETSLDQASFAQENVGCGPGSITCRLSEDLGASIEHELNQQQSNGGTLPFPAFTRIPDYTIFPEIFDRQGRDTDSSAGHLTLEYDLDSYLITAISGYVDTLGTAWNDIDFSPLPGFAGNTREEYEQFSQELRIQSIDGEKLDWMAGLYFQDSELHYDARLYIGVAMAGPANLGAAQGNQYNEDAQWKSAFAAATYQMTDTVNVDVGVRWSDVGKTGTNQAQTAGLIDPVTGPGEWVIRDNRCLTTPNTIIDGACANADYKDDDISGSVGFNWFASDNTMAYAKYATGFKAGGLNVGMSVAANLDDYIYDAEDVDAYELGLKNTLLDGRLEFNAAVYSSEYANLQVSTFDPTSDVATAAEFTVGNVAESTVEGIEISGRFAATDQLMLNYSLSLLDATYDDFPGAQCNNQEIADPTLCLDDPATPVDESGTTNRAGEDIEFAPPAEFSVGAEYLFSLRNSLELMLAGNVYWSDGYGLSTVFDRRLLQDSYERIDLRATLLSADGTWSASLFGSNLTDTITHGQLGPAIFNNAYTISYNRGRGWGAQMRYNF